MSRGSDDSGRRDDRRSEIEVEIETRHTGLDDTPGADDNGGVSTGTDDNPSASDIAGVDDNGGGTGTDDNPSASDIATTAGAPDRRRQGSRRSRDDRRHDSVDDSPGSSSSSSDDDSADDSPSSSGDDSGRRSGRGRGRGGRGRGQGRGQGRGGDDTTDDVTRDSIIGNSGNLKKRAYFFDDEAYPDGGVISNLQRVDKGTRYRRETIDAGETYELVRAGNGVSVDTLFRIDVGPTGTETKAFTDANGDNIWTQISETFVATQASSTPLA